PAGAADLAWRARANLAHWSRELVPVRAVLPHPGGSRYVAFGPDGKTILTAGWDGTVRLWEAATGKPLGPPARHGVALTSVASSPGGRSVLTGDEHGRARFWGVATGEPIGPPLTHAGNIESVAYSPDGRTALPGSEDTTARLWDARTGKPLGLPLAHRQGVL